MLLMFQFSINLHLFYFFIRVFGLIVATSCVYHLYVFIIIFVRVSRALVDRWISTISAAKLLCDYIFYLFSFSAVFANSVYFLEHFHSLVVSFYSYSLNFCLSFCSHSFCFLLCFFQLLFKFDFASFYFIKVFVFVCNNLIMVASKYIHFIKAILIVLRQILALTQCMSAILQVRQINIGHPFWALIF
jgi:hypothetical protein